MAMKELCTVLQCIKGWEVERNGMRIDNDEVIVSVRPSRPNHVCSGCGQLMLFIYDHYPPRCTRDFPAWDALEIDCKFLSTKTSRLATSPKSRWSTSTATI